MVEKKGEKQMDKSGKERCSFLLLGQKAACLISPAGQEGDSCVTQVAIRQPVVPSSDSLAAFALSDTEGRCVITASGGRSQAGVDAHRAREKMVLSAKAHMTN